MKEHFDNIEVEVITIKSEDVIATSGGSEKRGIMVYGANETEIGA